MTIDDQVRDEKLQYDINREAAKKNKHYHLEKLINVNIFQVRKCYPWIKRSFPLGKAFEKQIKTNEYQRIKQIAA